jgi:hypothetical protein
MHKRHLRLLGALGGFTAVLGIYTFLIRPWHLRWGLTDAEFVAIYPGDELLPNVTGHVTHAITIQATPEQIWPWLMQIGQDRGGFYSYTPLENAFGCEMPRIEKIVSEWPDRKVDEEVWFGTPKHFGGKAYMRVAIAQPNSAFVLAASADLAARQAATWGFFLKPIASDRTRLIVRLRVGETTGPWARILGYVFWEPAHFVMERKMMVTIRALAEKLPLHLQHSTVGN